MRRSLFVVAPVLLAASVAVAAPAPPAPPPPGSVAAAMRARGIAPADVVVAFAGSPAITAFAHQAVHELHDPGAEAGKLYDAIVALKHSGKIEGDLDNSPKARPPKTAAALMRIANTGGHLNRKAGCYELSALYVAAARSIGLDAVGVQRVDPSGTGQIGHIMAGVRFAPGGPLTIFDLQNEIRGTRWRFRELSDLQFAAHHYNHLAVAAYLHGNYDAALAKIEIALRLWPACPSFLNNRATIQQARGEPDFALADSVQAVQLAPDVPLYRYQLGRLRLASGNIDGAIESLHNALILRPRYGLARRDLGWAYLLAGDTAAAQAQLRRVVQERPTTPDAALYLALYYVATGAKSEAGKVVAAGLGRNAHDASLLALSDIVRGKAGGGAEARRLRKVLASISAARHAR